MAIPMEKFAGYLRWRPKPGGKEVKGPDGKVLLDEKGVPYREQEVWIDPTLMLKPGAAGPTVTKPKDCCGVLYWSADKDKVFDLLYPTE